MECLAHLGPVRGIAKSACIDPVADKGVFRWIGDPAVAHLAGDVIRYADETPYGPACESSEQASSKPVGVLFSMLRKHSRTNGRRMSGKARIKKRSDLVCVKDVGADLNQLL